MTATIAALLIVIWPGHDIRPMPMQSMQACEAARADIALADAGKHPGFRVQCISDSAASDLAA